MFVTTLSVAVLVFIACNRNHRPIIASVNVNPADSVYPGGTVLLKAVAVDDDNDPLTFTWRADAGTLSSNTGDSVVWTAPAAPTNATLTVICEDDKGGKDSTGVTLNVRGWRYDNVDETYDGPVAIPNPGTVEVNLDLSGSVPSSAFAESVWVTLEFDPDTLDGEFFKMWIIPPSGREILFWDNRTGPLEVDGEYLPGLNNEPVKGVWRLKIVREVAGEEGYLDAFNLDIDYRW